jgi:hypothetical protein
MKNGTRQIVVLGESNENHIIVENGIEPGNLIYLNTPEEPEKFNKLLGEDLISIIMEREKAAKEAERRANQQQMRSGGFSGRGGFGPEMSPEMREQFMTLFQQAQQGDTSAVRKLREFREKNGMGSGRMTGQQGTRQFNMDGQQGTRQFNPQGQGTQQTQQVTR